MAYEKTGDMMLFCHSLMLLEAVHAMLGLVKSGVSSTTIQVKATPLIPLHLPQSLTHTIALHIVIS